jgi:hypothetical protein
VNSSESSGIARLPALLADRDPIARGTAATELFRRGLGRVREATADWFKSDALAACFALDESRFPETTVGVAVHPAAFEEIRKANGMPRLADVPRNLDAEEFELHFEKNVRLDVLTTRDTEGDGAIARFLRKKGEGIQQVELSARQLDRATEILRADFGVAPIYPQARGGADGTRVNFFLLALGQGEKLLVELVESATASKQ